MQHVEPPLAPAAERALVEPRPPTLTRITFKVRTWSGAVVTTTRAVLYGSWEEVITALLLIMRGERENEAQVGRRRSLSSP